jgi:hypothetical protein
MAHSRHNPRLPTVHWIVKVSLVAVLLAAVSAFAATEAKSSGSHGPAWINRNAEARAAGPGPSPSVPGCPATIAAGFSCTMRQRIVSTERYLQTAPGEIGVEIHDRMTGATWQNAGAQQQFPTGSTSKLAMAADLLQRNETGAIQLSSDDWSQLGDMLNWSSDTAADTLWSEYEDDSFLGRIEQFGMQGAEFSEEPGYWGYMYCTASDLNNLMDYILTHAPASTRGYLVNQMTNVAPVQQWGVWGAGPENHPGDKDGWEDDGGTWITDTVGFAGPGERYTLSVMDDLNGYGSDGDSGFTVGSNTLTQIASMLFQGHDTAEPTVQATP